MDEEYAAPGGGGLRIVVLVLALLLLLLAGWGYLALRDRSQDLERAQGALELQVLTSRLGAAALYAEYGDFDQALSVVSRAFDGIQNYAIEQGSLPANYAAVLGVRDEVVASLARQRPEVRQRLVELFFALQIPVDTQLDPERIIPATDSGAGMAPPARLVPLADSAADSLERADTLAPVDTLGLMDTLGPGPRAQDTTSSP